MGSEWGSHFDGESHLGRGTNRLSATRVAKAKRRGRYSDGGGLWLQVSKWGTKAWVFQYTAANGRVRQFGLGSLQTVSLAEARDKALTARKQVREGVDPIEHHQADREQRRLEKATRLTFAVCTDEYIATHEAGWKNAKHREQWVNTLTTYAHPILGNLSVAEIDTSHVLAVLKPIWATKPETASRLRGRIERVLDFAKVRGARSGENPARWKGHLDHLLPKRSKVRRVEHHAALPYAGRPGFMSELKTCTGISARALEVTILTALRTGEVINAKWSEIDLAGKVWTIPAERMKGGEPHRVPLADKVVTILTNLPREAGSDYLFVGGTAGQSLSNMAMLELLRELRPGLTVHGFRSTFRDWAADTTSYPNHVLEQALAHKIANAVEAAYRRSDLVVKRTRLMSEWARYCYQPAGSATVTPIRRGRR
jgi:integrase